MATIHYPRFTVCRINAAGERVAVTSATITAYNVTAASSLSSTSSDSDGNVAAGTYTGTVGDIIRFGHATYPGYIYFTSTATAAEAYTHPDNIECTYVAENLAANLLEGQMVELYATDTDNPDVTPWKIGEGKTGTTVEIPFQSNVAKNLRIFPRTIDSKLGRVRQTFNITTGSQTVAVPATDTFAALAPLDPWHSVRRNSVDTDFETYDTRASRPLFEHFVTRTTTATTEQTIHRYSLSNGTYFLLNGDRVMFNYTFTTDSSAGDVYCRIKFAGTTIFDSGTLIDPALGNSQTLTVSGWISRKNTSTVRYSVHCVTTSVVGKDGSSKQGEITSLAFQDRLTTAANNTYDLLATIETSTAAGDASLTMAEGRYVNAVQCDLVTTSLWGAYEARYFKGSGVAQYSDGATITTDWQDLSGNARHLTRSGSPTWEGAELNGEAIVRMTPAATSKFSLPATLSGTNSIFIVWKLTDATVDGGNNFGSYSVSPDYYPYNTDGKIYDAFGSSAARYDCGIPYVTLTNYHTYYAWSKTNDWGLWLDGMKQYETTTNTVGWETTATIGFNGSSGYIKADIAAIYIFSAKLSDANVAKMYRYIQKEFGC